jgi:hypothetical protein
MNERIKFWILLTLLCLSIAMAIRLNNAQRINLVGELDVKVLRRI